MKRHGPTRGEHLFRLSASLAALVVFGVAAWVRGVSINIVTVELAMITVAFFGGSAAWSAWHLWKDRG